MRKLLAQDGILRRIIEAGSAAPSIHNTQPWRFNVAGDDVLEVWADPDRTLWVADPRARALYLSCGAALFNVRTAIRMTGYNPRVWPLPYPERSPAMIAIVQAEPGRPAAFAERAAYEAIWRRHTDRGPFTDEPIPESVQVALEQAASFEFASLRMLSEQETEIVLDLAAQASAELADDVDHRIELQNWIATERTSDGIPAAALPPRPQREPAPVRAADLGSAVPMIERPTTDFERQPHLAVLTTARDQPADWLRAGQAMQRVLLTATAHNLAASFLFQMIELKDMRGEGAPDWPWAETPQMVIRLGYGAHAARTPRRRVDDVLTRTATATRET